MNRIKAEYIWMDGHKPTQKLRSKTKILDQIVETVDDLPLWGFDGSSTNQADGNDSDCMLKPVYKTFPGWKTSTKGVRNSKDLPDNAKNYIHAIEDFVGVKISSISTSPEREDTILLENPFGN